MLSNPRQVFAALSCASLICVACQPSLTDDHEANKQVVRDLFAALDAQDYELLMQLTSEDGVTHVAGYDEPVTGEVMLEVIPAYYTAFPDYNHVIEELVAEGDLVVARITYRGTHEGDFEGIPATGNSVTYTGMQLFRVVDGVIMESWLIEDNLSFMTQLGMQLTPAEPAP